MQNDKKYTITKIKQKGDKGLSPYKIHTIGVHSIKVNKPYIVTKTDTKDDKR